MPAGIKIYTDLALSMLGYSVGDEFSKLRGRKGNGRRGKKTMERGKGKGSRIMAYLRQFCGKAVVAKDLCKLHQDF